MIVFVDTYNLQEFQITSDTDFYDRGEFDPIVTIDEE